MGVTKVTLATPTHTFTRVTLMVHLMEGWVHESHTAQGVNDPTEGKYLELPTSQLELKKPLG